MKIEDIYMRDPYILLHEGVYYLTGTTDRHWMGGRSEGLKIYTSTDLENFDGPHTVFQPSDNFWSYECWWAPELHFYNGKFYIFCTFHNKDMKRKGTQILVSETVMGPYRPLSDELATNEEWECLDGTLYVEDGQPYCVYCREWTVIGNGEIYFQQLSPDLTRKIGPSAKMTDAKSASWTVGLNHHDPKRYDDYITDGPCLYRMKNGDLIMLWSSFSTKGYTVGMAKPMNKKINGWWHHLPETLFSGDGGHCMVFRDKEDALRLSLHVNNSQHGYEHPCLYTLDENDRALVLLK
ncbi:MAG: glycoside hydrolase family 43 protein [Clostridiales bacterium]|jgi:GH43 family beta-xylosidase|nr:glycoside hydrolase family 43 protein [Clostridiales bacterium]